MRRATENIISKFGWILLAIAIIVLIGVIVFSLIRT